MGSILSSLEKYPITPCDTRIVPEPRAIQKLCPGWTFNDAGPKSASGKRATADCERLAEDREPEWPKAANCGFLGLESAYSSNEP